MATQAENESDAESVNADTDVTVIPETPFHSETDDETEDIDGVDLLRVAGTPLMYKIPRFPVITIKIRQMTFQAVLPDDSVATYHGFIRDHPSLERTDVLPTTIRVLEYCFVEVDEFCRGAPAHHLNHPAQGVYLVWEWEWMRPPPDRQNDTPPAPSLIYPPSTETEVDNDKQVERVHTVRFKCIGATRDQSQQDALEQANEVLRVDKEEVQVALFKEPDNPVDAKAIAFKCLLNGEWCRIGYVVREALDDMHDALSCNAITEVKLGWVKFRIDFQASGPGFYAAIDITRKGHWSETVCRSASPR